MALFEWNAVDVIRVSSALTALFLCSQHLSHVLTLDSLFTFAFTVWLTVYPRHRLNQAVAPDRTVDALHEFLVFNAVSLLMVPAMIWFLSIDPADVTIRTGLALSRIVGLGLAIILTVICHHEDNLFNPEVFQMLIAPMLGALLVYTVHLFYNNAVNADRHVGNLNAFIHVDFILSLLVGLVYLCAPFLAAEYIFHQTLDGLHSYLYRVHGALLLGYACLPYLAPKLRSSSNKRAVLFSRAWCLLVILLITFRNYRRGEMSDRLGCRLLIAMLVILTLPSAIGSMRNEYANGWQLPWKGLRVPRVAGKPADNLINAAKELRELARVKPHRRKKLLRRSKTRHRSKSRRSKSRRGRRSGSRKRR